MYRVSCYIVETLAATTSSTLPSCRVTWTDKDTSTVETIAWTATGTANVVGTFGAVNTAYPSAGVIYVKASTNIQISTSGYASSGATSMAFALHAKVEAM
jgi:hypothetical protein